MPYATEDDFDSPSDYGGDDDHYATEADFDPVEEPGVWIPDSRGLGQQLWENTTRFGLDALSGVEHGLGGLVRAVQEHPNFPLRREFEEQAPEDRLGENLVRDAARRRAYAAEQYPIYSKAGQTINDLGSGIIPLLNPAGPIIAGMEAYGGGYERLRERDIDPETARRAAIAPGLLAYGGARATIPRAIEGTTLGQLVGVPALNALFGTGQRAADTIVDARVLGDVPSAAELKERFAGTPLLLDLAMGGGLGAAGYAVKRGLGGRTRRADAEQVDDFLREMQEQASPEVPPDAPLGLPYLPDVPNISGETAPPIELGVSRGTRQFPEPPLPERAPFPDQPRTLDVIPPEPNDPRLVQSQPDITDPLALEVLRSGARTPEQQAEAEGILADLRRGIPQERVGPTQTPVTREPAARARTLEEQAQAQQTLQEVRQGPSRIVDPQYRPREVVPLTPEGKTLPPPITKTQLAEPTIVEPRAEPAAPAAPERGVVATFPESAARAKAAPEPAPQVEPAKPAEPARSTRDIFGLDEGGFVTTQPVSAAARKIRDLYDSFTSPEGGDIPGALTVRLPEIERYLGRKGAQTVRENIAFPKTIAAKSPQFKRIFDAALGMDKTHSAVAFDALENLEPYYSVRDPVSRKRVDQFLIAARRSTKTGKPFEITPDSLTRTSLTPPEQQAVLAVRKTMDQSLGVYEQALITRIEHLAPEDAPERIAEVRDYVRALRTQNFVPWSRFGDKFVAARSPSGELLDYSFHANDRAAAKKVAGIKAKYPDAVIRKGAVQTPSDAAYSMLPRQLLGAATSLDPHAATKLADQLPPRGFTKHLAHADLVEGFDENIGRSLAEYVEGLARFTANSEAQPKFKAALESMPKEGKLLEYSDKYIQNVMKNGGGLPQVRQALALYYLGGNIKSAFVNLTQSATTTYPILAKYTSKPSVEWGAAMRTTGHYLANKKGFAKSQPELAAALKEAERQGILGGGMHELAAMKAGKDPRNKLSPSALAGYWMAPFAKAEQLNRIHAYIAGHRIATKRGLTGAERAAFAETLVNDSQFVYSKANKPQLAQGSLAPAFTFRLWTANWLRLLRNEGLTSPTGKRMLGSMLAMGGASAFPGAAIAIKALQKQGEDPYAALREMMNPITGKGPLGKKAQNTVLYGLPNLLGFNVSGAISLNDPITDIEQGAGATLGRAAVGVPWDIGERVAKAAYLRSLDHPLLGRAGEALLPEGIRHMAVAARAAREGFKSAKGIPILADPTPVELAYKGLGFTPSRLAQRYEEIHSQDVLQQSIQQAREGWGFRMKKALVEGNRARYDELRREMAALNRARPELGLKPPSASEIRAFRDERRNPEAARIKRMPKAARRKMAELIEQQR